MAVYVDTGAWIALYEPRDENHDTAKRRLRSLRDSHEVLVAGWHTLVEFIDGIVHHYDQARAAQELDRIRGSPSVRIEPAHPHREEALDLFDDRRDWGIDLSDAISFALMGDLGLERAFAYDEDFETAGFTVLR